MCNENNEEITIIVYSCTMMIITEEQSVVINLRELINQIDSSFGRYG